MKHFFIPIFMAALLGAASLQAQSPAASNPQDKPVLLQKYGQMARFVRMEGSVVVLEIQGRIVSADQSSFPDKDQTLIKELAGANGAEAASGPSSLSKFSVADFVIGGDQGIYGIARSGGGTSRDFLFKADAALTTITELCALTGGDGQKKTLRSGKDGKLYVAGTGVPGTVLVYDSPTGESKTIPCLPPTKPTDISQTDWNACQSVQDFCVTAEGVLYGLGKEVLWQCRLEEPRNFKVFVSGWKAFVDGGDGFLYGGTADGIMRFKMDAQEWSVAHAFELTPGTEKIEMLGRPVLMSGAQLFGYIRETIPGGSHFDKVKGYSMGRQGFKETMSAPIPADQGKEATLLQWKAMGIPLPEELPPLPKGALAADADAVYSCSATGVIGEGPGDVNPTTVAEFPEAKNVEKMAVSQGFAYLLGSGGRLNRVPLDSKFLAAHEQRRQKEKSAQDEQKQRVLAETTMRQRLQENNDLAASRRMKPNGPQTKHVIAVQKSGSQQVVSIDGHLGKGYRQIVTKGSAGAGSFRLISPAISADDERVVYVAREQNNQFVVVENGSGGPEFSSIFCVMFAPTGHRLAYIGMRGNSHLDGHANTVSDVVLVDDGKEYSLGAWRSQNTDTKPEGLSFSPDGTRLAYVHYSPIPERHEWLANVVVDGQPQKQNARRVKELVWSQDSKHVAYVSINREMPYHEKKINVGYDDEETQRAVVDGVPDPSKYSEIRDIRFAAASPHHVYAAKTLRSDLATGRLLPVVWAVVSDGKEMARYPVIPFSNDDSVQEIAISPDGARVAYAAIVSENGVSTTYVYENGSKISLGYARCKDLELSPDGEGISFTAISFSGQTFRVVDGKEVDLKHTRGTNEQQ